jgi:carboxyl-terminal processing protease
MKKMKILLFALIPASLLTVFGVQTMSKYDKGSQTQVVYAPGDLQPTATQKKVEGLVAQILGSYHYRRVPLNDSLSSKIFDNYIKDLDGNKVYFTASDIAGFEKYRNKLDDELQSGDLTAAYDIYNLFQKRLKERYQYIFSIIDKPFDFKVDENYVGDREKSAWAKSTADLDDVWRKTIKLTMLDFKINGKADTSAVKDLKSRYKTSEKILTRAKSEDVFQIFMNAFTESVDPHTNYMIPKAAAQFNQEMAQSFEGIGATLRYDNDFVTIVDLIPGGPAYRSKLLTAKDRIVGVAQGDNGAYTDIIGWMTDDAVKLIKGPKATVVRLKILSANAAVTDVPKEVRLVREKIKLEEQTAKSEVLNYKRDGKDYKLGLITIPMFYRDFEGARKNEDGFKSTTADVKRFLGEFKTEKVDGVVLDLRNNGGGSLTEAVSLTGLFIKEGPVVQRKHADGDISQEFDRDVTQAYDGPLSVLVNRFSASASEIFAGAIQDYKRGVVLGEQTYGKGTVQSIVELDRFLKGEPENVGQLKITMEKFYRITGSSTQHKGVTPDIEFPSGFSAEEYGESSQPSALPWDMIASTKFTPYPDANEKVIASLKSNYQERLKTDADLKKLVKDFDEWKKNKKIVVSLQEDKRRKEVADRKKKNEEDTAAASTGEDETKDPEAKAKDPKETKTKGKHDKDTYLKETERIMTDLMTFYPQTATKVTQLDKK